MISDTAATVLRYDYRGSMRLLRNINDIEIRTRRDRNDHPHIQVRERIKNLLLSSSIDTVVSRERERKRALFLIGPWPPSLLRDMPIDLFLLGATNASFDPLKLLTRATCLTLTRFADCTKTIPKPLVSAVRDLLTVNSVKQ